MALFFERHQTLGDVTDHRIGGEVIPQCRLDTAEIRLEPHSDRVFILGEH